MAWLIERNDTAVPVYLAGVSPESGAIYGTFTVAEALKFETDYLAQLQIQNLQLLDNWEVRSHGSNHIPLRAAETDLR